MVVTSSRKEAVRYTGLNANTGDQGQVYIPGYGRFSRLRLSLMTGSDSSGFVGQTFNERRPEPGLKDGNAKAFDSDDYHVCWWPTVPARL